MAFRGSGNGVIALALCLTLTVSLYAQNAPAAQTSKQQIRIVALLAQIADEARSFEDVKLATKLQSQAALMLWPYDREQARSIFNRTFLSLLQKTSGSNAVANNTKTQERQPKALSLADKQQLLTELLNQIASRDAEMAEELARRLADSSLDLQNSWPLSQDYCDVNYQGEFDSLDLNTDLISKDSDRSDLLVNVALQVVERDPYRAMALGQLSVNVGTLPCRYAQAQEVRPVLPTRLAQLLTLMRASDSTLADLLFSSATAALERLPVAHLSDIHTLGSYLVTAINGPSKDAISSTQVARFLNLAYNRLAMRRSEKEADFVYLIGRQLTGLFMRYKPDRLVQWQRRISELSESNSGEREIAAIPQPASPFDIARAAREADDERESDRLYARAAFEWLTRGESNESASSALKIKDAQLRDRVLIQIIRQQSSKSKSEDLISLARKIENKLMRADAIIRLARSIPNSSDRLRVSEFLNEAESYAAKASPSIEQARTLLSIVSVFSSFDDLRAFEVMQTAVKSINATRDEKPDAKVPSQASESKVGDIYNLNFENALTALAGSDFDRALLLAQQLSDKSVSLMAQIAVCRGGLAIPAASDLFNDESQ
jgi:hypothetical protein